MKMSFETEIGAQAPIGYWDPLGLLTKDPSQVSWCRLGQLYFGGRTRGLLLVGFSLLMSK